MPTALMYHDIVEADRLDSSGFKGPAAARYKIRPADFQAHLAHLAALLKPPIAMDEPVELDQPAPVLLTFDDGGASCYAPVAGLIEGCGWRGFFFIPTDQVGAPGFLDAGQLRSLRSRGHIIGSHTCSHPIPMWGLRKPDLLREWDRSRAILEDILGESVTTASVPGGFHSCKVARAAAEAGIRALFTSEPTGRTHRVDGCLVVGRYTIRPGMTARSVAAIAAGHRAPRFRQAVSWNIKKVAKALAGTAYMRLGGHPLKSS